MTQPRKEIFDAKTVGMYHCVSRCVRRAFLCGMDKVSGISYEHRRSWVKGRLGFLVEVFAFELISYAVMMNHLHFLIRNRPDTAATWSKEEVAIRWRTLFPRRWKNGRPAKPNEAEISAICEDLELVELYRERLCSISWFNRCLSEHIARRANKEDECTGRFWEGRFKSQRIHEVSGLLACSAYIDLNPLRAGFAATPEESDYTSVQDRIRRYKGTLRGAVPKLLSLEEATGEKFSTEQYLELVDATGRIYIQGKGKIPDELSDILTRLGIKSQRWLDTTSNYRYRFKRIVGPAKALIEAAKKFGKARFQGIVSARAAFT